MNVHKLKLILSIFFLTFGLLCAVLTYTTDTLIEYQRVSDVPYNDGIAIGLGIISGFSFLSSVLLLNSLNKSKD